MIPQIAPSDSLKKSGDKLPFAPFLNRETIEQKKSTEKKSKETTPVSVKKTVKPSTPKTDKPKQATTQEQPPKQELKTVVVKEKKTQTPAAPVTQASAAEIPVPLKTAETNAGTTTITPLINDSLLADSALAQAALKIDSFEFKFTDDETFEKSSTVITPYLNSSKYFKAHNLTNTSGTPQVHTTLLPDWFTIILILMVAGITIIKMLYNKIFRQLFEAFYSLAVSNQVVRDENILVQRASVLLNIVFYGIAALFLYYVSVKYEWSRPFYNQGIFRFFLFAILIACFYSIKMLLIKLLGHILEIEKPVAVYIFNIFLINNILGMVLIPVIVLLAFAPAMYATYILYVGVACILAAFFYRVFRAFTIGLGMSLSSLYYLFLYFCTLEIAPVLLIAKIV